jgi:hypothetical protein
LLAQGTLTEGEDLVVQLASNSNQVRSVFLLISTLLTFLKKQDTLMRMPTVLSLPLQLVFPG